jgi:hypothetical protein
MKTTIDSLKARVATPAVITAVVVTLAVTGGGIRLTNHNETVLRDRS